MDFAVPADLSENKRKQKERQVLRPCERTKKAVEDDGDTIYNCCSCNGSQRLGKKAGKVGNRRNVSRLSNYCIVEICQNTEKSPGHLRRLAVTQIPLKDYQPTLVGKNLQESIIKEILTRKVFALKKLLSDSYS